MQKNVSYFGEINMIWQGGLLFNGKNTDERLTISFGSVLFWLIFVGFSSVLGRVPADVEFPFAAGVVHVTDLAKHGPLSPTCKKRSVQ